MIDEHQNEAKEHIDVKEDEVIFNDGKLEAYKDSDTEVERAVFSTRGGHRITIKLKKKIETEHTVDGMPVTKDKEVPMRIGEIPQVIRNFVKALQDNDVKAKVSYHIWNQSEKDGGNTYIYAQERHYERWEGLDTLERTKDDQGNDVQFIRSKT